MSEKQLEGSKFPYLVTIIFLFLLFYKQINVDIFKPIKTPIIQCVHCHSKDCKYKGENWLLTFMSCMICMLEPSIEMCLNQKLCNC